MKTGVEYFSVCYAQFVPVPKVWAFRKGGGRVWSVRLSLLNVAYTLFSNLRFGAFAGLGNTLKLCRTRECVCCHLC